MIEKENNEEMNFDVVDKKSMTLVEERLDWQAKHSKPWYLALQKPKKKYPKNKEQDND